MITIHMCLKGISTEVATLLKVLQRERLLLSSAAVQQDKRRKGFGAGLVRGTMNSPGVPGSWGPPCPPRQRPPRDLLVGVDVADGDGGEGQLLELDGDRDRGAVVVHEELGALPEDEPDGAQGQQDPDEPAQAAPGHHDAAAAVGVGVQAVPPHQLAQRRRLRALHRQRPLDAGRDLLPGGHGAGGTCGGTERPPERGGDSAGARRPPTARPHPHPHPHRGPATEPASPPHPASRLTSVALRVRRGHAVLPAPAPLPMDGAGGHPGTYPRRPPRPAAARPGPALPAPPHRPPVSPLRGRAAPPHG